jgi:hypothetical protein
LFEHLSFTSEHYSTEAAVRSAHDAETDACGTCKESTMKQALIGFSRIPLVNGLRRGELLALRGRRGVRIESRRGAIWVTQDGDPNDVVLDAGQACVLERDAPVLIQALDPAWVAVERSADDDPAAIWQRLWQRLGAALGRVSAPTTAG